MSHAQQLAKQVAVQLALATGALRPKEPTRVELQAELTAAFGAYRSAATAANRGRLNKAFAMLRDARSQSGRFSALWLAESNALRAIYSQGLVEARTE